ncbi:MAG: histidine kinase [Saprospiraceae bacterium]|nr:histidine kinase [Saprospiraceae bacterium]
MLKLISAQTEVYNITNFTTYHGLPSNEVFTTFQDSEGFIWVGTKLGVSKFDGYSFQNYGFNDGLKDLTISQITQDELGFIWVCSVYGNIYKLVNNKFEAYIFQECIDDYKAQFAYISGFEMNIRGGGNNPELILGMFNVGFLKIDENGFKYLYQSDHIPSQLYYCSSKSNIVIAQAFLKDSLYWCNGCVLNTNVYNFDGQKLNFITNIHNRSNQATYVSQLDSIIIMGFAEQLVSIDTKSQTVYVNKNYPYVTGIVQFDSTSFLITHYIKKGIFNVKISSKSFDLVKEIFIDDGIRGIFKDKQGSFWISSYSSGLYRLVRNSFFRKFDLNASSGKFPYNKKICIDTLNKLFYTNTFSSDIQEYNLATLQSVRYKNSDPFISSMRFSSTGVSVAFRKGAIRICEGIKYSIKHNYSKFFYLTGFSPFGSLDSLLAFNGTDAFVLTKDTLFPIFRNRAFSSKNRILDICSGVDRAVIVAKLDGLYTIQDSAFVKYINLDTLIKSTISVLFNEGESGLWVGTNSEGIFIEHNKIIYHLTEKEGLLSNQITKIISDYRSNYYVLSNKGIDLVYFKDAKWEIRNLNYLSDLLKESITDITAYDSILWIATYKDIYIAQIPKIENITYKPFLVEFKDIEGNSFISPYRLKSDHNDLSFTWCSLDLEKLGNIKYRYKIKEEDRWIETNDRKLLLMSLKPWNYQFQVQAQNSNGQWSQSLVIPFQILQPWWKSFYFIIFCFIVFLLIVWLVVRSKISAIHKETKVQNTIFRLTNQALISQINPHFIFNCLNSIKLLIKRQDNAHAERYLGYFSKLLRTTLSATRKENWTIAEEIDLLENYVKLENLRLKNKINFTSHVDEKIDLLILPSMLCQTLVENSIKHGIRNDKEILNIKLNIEKLSDQLLQLQISDDGMGFGRVMDKEENIGKDGIQLGLELTRQRLKLFNDNAKENYLFVESPIDGLMEQGTKISLLIKILT